jgi:predicted transcriptional regulator
MQIKVRMQSALSIEANVKLLQAVDERSRSKTEFCKIFGIPNSTLSKIIKNRDKVVK